MQKCHLLGPEIQGLCPDHTARDPLCTRAALTGRHRGLAPVTGERLASAQSSLTIGFSGTHVHPACSVPGRHAVKIPDLLSPPHRSPHDKPRPRQHLSWVRDPSPRLLPAASLRIPSRAGPVPARPHPGRAAPRSPGPCWFPLCWEGWPGDPGGGSRAEPPTWPPLARRASHSPALHARLGARSITHALICSLTWDFTGASPRPGPVPGTHL